MSIRVRTLILIAGTTVILLGVLYLIAALLFLGRFEKLERQESLRGLEQARGALDNELGQLSLFDHDWASWDDTYAFIRDGNRGYAEANLMDETFTGAKLNLMIFLERDGRVRFAKAYDWRADKPLPEPSALLRLLTPGSPLEPLTDEDRHTGGVLLLPKAPLLIASHPILTSTSQGPSRGTLIMGRYLR
jgi:sensor domain CHASE-containing protein